MLINGAGRLLAGSAFQEASVGGQRDVCVVLRRMGVLVAQMLAQISLVVGPVRAYWAGESVALGVGSQTRSHPALPADVVHQSVLSSVHPRTKLALEFAHGVVTFFYNTMDMITMGFLVSVLEICLFLTRGLDMDAVQYNRRPRHINCGFLFQFNTALNVWQQL